MRPFEGIRILDITHVLAAPFAAYQFAVLGADVIKIERPGDPDQSRTQGLVGHLQDGCMSTPFLTQASNKRSITVDMKTPAGVEIIRRLAKTADILVENYRPGALDALGIGYAQLGEINPALIYCSISAYGQNGPRREHTGYDHVVQASSGLMAINGTPDEHPVKMQAACVDYASGTTAAFALAAALFQRSRTGRGQRIDVAMQDVAMVMLGNLITDYSYTKTPVRPTGNWVFPYATNGCYPTKDGILVIAGSNHRQEKRLWEALGRPDMARGDPAARLASRKADGEVLAEILMTRTAREWEEFFQARHVPASRVRLLEEAIADPQVAARGLFHLHEQCDGVDRPFVVPVAGFNFEHDGPRIDSAPPRMGADNVSVLTEAGYSEAEIEELQQQGCI